MLNVEFSYVLEGVIHPVSEMFTISHSNFGAEIRNGEKICTWKLSFNNSIFKAYLTSNYHLEDDFDDLASLRNKIKTNVELYTGLYGVARSVAYRAEFLKMINLKNGNEIKFRLSLENIDLLLSSEIESMLLKSSKQILSKDPEIVFLLKETFLEYQRGIENADSSAMHFYRSIESVRNIIWRLKHQTFEYNKRSQVWNLMYSTIGDDLQKNVEDLAQIAADVRHGKTPIQYGTQRLEWAKLSRVLITKSLTEVARNHMC